MLLDRFKDWRIRTTALRDLKRRARATEFELRDSQSHPLQLAEQALQASDLAGASRWWAEALKLFPEQCLGSETSIGILLGLGRIDELESLMNKGRALWPNNGQYMSGLALVNERRRNLEQAANWWIKVHKASAHDRNAYLNGSNCLCAVNRQEEAAALLKVGTERRPHDLEIWLASARVSEATKDYSSALRNYDYIANDLWHPSGSEGGARVCMATDDPEGAAERLSRGHQRHPHDPDIIAALARQAERVVDFEEALKHWKHLRLTFPRQELFYREEARCLAALGRMTEVDLILSESAKRFSNPGSPVE